MKKFFIVLALIMGVQTQADAQLLKKIGNAIDKGAKKLDQVTDALSKAAGGNQSQTGNNNKAEKLISSVKVGPTTVASYGDLQGMAINWIGAYRIYGSNDVAMRYQHVNTSGIRLSIAEGEGYGTAYAIDTQGQRYANTHFFMGGKGMSYSNGCIMTPGTKDLVVLTFRGVPLGISNLQSVFIGATVGCVDQNTAGHYGSYRITNIPISLLPSMTAKGVFGEQKVLIGSSIASLPKSISFLYDNYTVKTEEDEGEKITTVTFTLKGRETMTAISNDQKTIANIDVLTPNVHVLVGESYYTCGSLMSRMKMERGILKDEYDNVSYQNIFFDEDTEGKICAIHI